MIDLSRSGVRSRIRPKGSNNRVQMSLLALWWPKEGYGKAAEVALWKGRLCFLFFVFLFGVCVYSALYCRSSTALRNVPSRWAWLHSSQQFRKLPATSPAPPAAPDPLLHHHLKDWHPHTCREDNKRHNILSQHLDDTTLLNLLKTPVQATLCQ